MNKKKLTRKERKLRKKLAKENRKKEIKRDFLRRELKYGQINRAQLETKWRHELCKIVLPNLQLEYKFAVNTIERIFDAKDFQISYLLDELYDADEQYNSSLKLHCYNINKIILLYNDQLNSLKTSYDNDLEFTLKIGKEETDNLNKRYNEEADFMNKMINRLKAERTELETTVLSSYISKVETQHQSFKHDIQINTEKLERKFSKLWMKVKQVLRQYQNETENYQQEYEKLYNNDVKTRNLIKEQSEKIFYLQDFLRQLKDRQASEKEDLDALITFKENERNYFANSFKVLKQQLVKDIDVDKKQLEFLVFESNILLKDLERISKKSEMVIKLYEMSRKYETLKEKVLPFPILIKLKELKKFPPPDPCVIYSKKLETIWIKCGRTEASILALKSEYKKMTEKNKFLKEEMRHFFTGQKSLYNLFQDKEQYLIEHKDKKICL